MLNQNVKEFKLEDESLTVEKLRTFKGFENISNKEAIELIQTYKRFSYLIIECFDQYVISLKEARDD
jgi:hypothetical protein